MKSFDDRAAEIARSNDFGDIRIPLDIAARLKKGGRAEKKETVDGVDLDKIRAQKEADKDEEPEDKKKPEGEGEEESDAEKSLRRIGTETLQKARLLLVSRQPDPFYVKVGMWVSKSLATCDVATLQKAVSSALPDYSGSKGKTLVAGLKEPVLPTEHEKKIVKANTEIAALQREMAEKGLDPFENSVIFGKLQRAYEYLAECIMNSMGLGLQTEDLIAPDPTTEAPAAMVSIKKSQAEEPVVVPENTGNGVIVSL